MVNNIIFKTSMVMLPIINFHLIYDDNLKNQMKKYFKDFKCPYKTLKKYHELNNKK